MSYKPQTVKAKSWDEIEAHYVALNKQENEYGRLLDLVRHIKFSGLGDKLFACTSLTKLIISIYDPIEWEREALHIEFDIPNQKWTFKYISKPNEKSHFERQYDSELGIEKFDKFISMIKW